MKTWIAILVSVSLAAAIITVGFARRGGKQGKTGFLIDPDTSANRRLLEAVFSMDPIGARAALDEGADADATVHRPGEASRIPLAFCARLTVQSSNADVQIFRLLTAHMRDLSVQDPAGSNLLLEAVTLQDLPSVAFLVSKGVDPNCSSRSGIAPFSASLFSSSPRLKTLPPIAAYLLDHGANPNLPMIKHIGETPLIFAARRGQVELVAALLAKGADPGIRGPMGETALAVALRRHQTEVIALLRDRTPMTIAERARLGDAAKVAAAMKTAGNPNARTGDGSTALIEAVMGKNAEVVRLLIEHGASPVVADIKGYSPMHYAAMLGEIDVMQLLLSHGADVNQMTAADVNGRSLDQTPLVSAAACAQPGSLSFLIRHGAAVDVHDQGFLALRIAIRTYGSPERPPDGSKRLTDKALILKAQDQVLSNLLGLDTDLNEHHGELVADAAYWGNAGLVQKLVARGANPNGRDKDGDSALKCALNYWVDNGPLPMVYDKKRDDLTNSGDGPGGGSGRDLVRYLISKRANVNEANFNGETPLMDCAGGNAIDAANLLFGHGAKLELADNNGWTALHWAASQNDTDFARFLINRGARLNVRDKKGITPLMLAIIQDEEYIDGPVTEKDTMEYPQGRVEKPADLVNTAEMLVKAGADSKIRATNGKSAMDFAKMFGFSDVQRMLATART